MGKRDTEKVLKSSQQLLLTSACPPSMRIYKCVKRRVNTQVPRRCTTMVHLLCLWAGHNLVVTSSQCSQCCSGGSVYCRVMKVKFTTYQLTLRALFNRQTDTTYRQSWSATCECVLLLGSLKIYCTVVKPKLKLINLGLLFQSGTIVKIIMLDQSIM